MHELSIMANLLESAVAAAGGETICALRVRVGPLSGVVVEALRFAFESLAPGTPAEGAKLLVEETVPRFQCQQCGKEFQTSVGSYECSFCGSTDGELRGGNELELISIEVPDHV